MEQMKCPGQDTRFWKPDDIFVAECPKCGAEIEFFKDDARRRCAWCGHMFYNPKIELGCAEWCQYAEKCVPDLVRAKKAAQNFKELLSEMAKSHLAGNPAAWDRTAKGVAYAQDLLKAGGVTNPKSLTIEVTGDESKVEKLLSLLKTFGIIDLTRTGKVALPRK